VRHRLTEKGLSLERKCNPSWFAPWVKPGDTAVDIGAANGDMTNELLRLVGNDGRVHAMEPRYGLDQDITAALDQLVLKGPVTVWNVAVGRTQRPRAVRAQWLAVHAVCVPEFGRIVEVDTKRLDYMVPHAALVKIDAQGSEVEILHGAGHLLGDVPVWIVEVYPAGLERAGASAKVLWTLLTDAGYTVYEEGRPVSEEKARKFTSEHPPVFSDWTCLRLS
jgi:FkbM family methyltransferase